MQSKSELRRRILDKRSSLSNEERLKNSLFICDSIGEFLSKEFITSAAFALYEAINSEVDLASLAEKMQKQGARVLKPAMLAGQGNMEFVDWSADFDQRRIVPAVEMCGMKTASAEDINVVICPVVAFDKNRNRLGYGGGYYDRYLSRLSDDALKIGVAFACQEVDAIPTEEHDISLDYIVTEKVAIS